MSYQTPRLLLDERACLPLRQDCRPRQTPLRLYLFKIGRRRVNVPRVALHLVSSLVRTWSLHACLYLARFPLLSGTFLVLPSLQLVHLDSTHTSIPYDFSPPAVPHVYNAFSFRLYRSFVLAPFFCVLCHVAGTFSSFSLSRYPIFALWSIQNVVHLPLKAACTS